MSVWDDGQAGKPEWPRGLGWLRTAWKTGAIALVIFGLMGPMVLLRLAGKRRASQRIVQIACRACLWIVGIKVAVIGTPMQGGHAVVANHSSWLDIFTLNAVQKVSFVSKAEVQNWPLLGVISRSTGTVFIERRQSHAAKHRDMFLERIKRGETLLFFPEGTSTDGRRLLPFKPTLFQAFFEEGLRETLSIQPVTLRFIAPEGQDTRFYGWWGEMDFAPHFAKVLAARKQGRIEVVFHAPIAVAQTADRKEMARLCETAVRAGLDA